MNAMNIPACGAFADVLNAVLDGDTPMNALLKHPHYGDCAGCRATVHAARLLQSHTVTVPKLSSDFAARTVLAMQQSQLAEQRPWSFRQRVSIGVGIVTALAACILLAVSMIPTAGPNTRIPDGLVLAPSKPVTESVNDAKNAVASLTVKVAEESYAPARNLIFASADRVVSPVPASTSEPLADIPEAAKAGFEPISTTTRRAFNALLRDANSLAGTGKKNS